MSRSSAAITLSSNCLKKPPSSENCSPRSLRISTENTTRWPSSKPKDTRVGDGRHAPGGQDHVHAAQPAQVVVAGVPAGVVVGVAAPVEVAHVPQAHVVALHRALRHAAHLVGPVAVVGRPQRVPPDQQRDEGQRPPRPPAAAGAQGTTDDQQAQQPEMQRGPGRHGHAARRRAAGKLEPQRAGAPGGQRQQADAGQQAQPGEGRR